MSNVAALRNLHNALLKVRDLEGDLDQGPRRLKSHQARVEAQQKKVDDEHDAIKKMKMRIHEKEVSIKEFQQNIAKHQTQMGQVTTNKEYQALKHEIENEKQATRVVEDEILELMMQLEDLTKALPEHDKGVAGAKSDLKKAEEEMARRLAEKKEILVAAHAELQAAEAALPEEARALYKRLQPSMGWDALAPLNGRSCAGCYTEATAQQYNNLLADRLVPCKNCARLLYLPQ